MGPQHPPFTGMSLFFVTHLLIWPEGRGATQTQQGYAYDYGTTQHGYCGSQYGQEPTTPQGQLFGRTACLTLTAGAESVVTLDTETLAVPQTFESLCQILKSNVEIILGLEQIGNGFQFLLYGAAQAAVLTAVQCFKEAADIARRALEDPNATEESYKNAIKQIIVKLQTCAVPALLTCPVL